MGMATSCMIDGKRGSTVTYRIHDVAVDGGALRVGEWSPEDPAAPTVIAVHGITASHMSWAMVAQALPEVRLIAPDLRGRGRSAELPGPFGMARHAADLEAVIEALDVPRALLIGHSMGGFVAVVTSHLYPDRFSQALNRRRSSPCHPHRYQRERPAPSHPRAGLSAPLDDLC